MITPLPFLGGGSLRKALSLLPTSGTNCPTEMEPFEAFKIVCENCRKDAPRRCPYCPVTQDDPLGVFPDEGPVGLPLGGRNDRGKASSVTWVLIAPCGDDRGIRARTRSLLRAFFRVGRSILGVPWRSPFQGPFDGLERLGPEILYNLLKLQVIAG